MSDIERETKLIDKLDGILYAMDRLGLEEYIRYANDKRRLMRVNFIAGAARGLGMAIGFTILGAIVIALIKRLALDNLPGIGGFVADVVRIVNERL